MLALNEVKNKSINEALAELDISGYGFGDYESGYIYDIIHEIADSNTSIYYSDIMNFIKENPYALQDCIAEGFYDPSHNFNIYDLGQAAEYMTIYNEACRHLEDDLKQRALLRLERTHNINPDKPLDIVDEVLEIGFMSCDTLEYVDSLVDDAVKYYMEAE